MEYYVKSVIPIIESNYDNFTTVEKTIADFFLKNSSKEGLTAKEVAEKLYVSEASLSRFAQKCGFRGYREFVYQYGDSLVKKHMIGNTGSVLDTYQKLLNKTYALVDEEQIVRLGKYLNQAERVLVCGKGSSGLAAGEMELRFMRIGVDIDSIRDSDMMRMQAVFQDYNSLVFGISISGETEEVLYLLRAAHKRGAKTVLITSKNKDKFSEFCNEVVLLPILKNLEHGNVISPQFPILIMLDIIYSHYVEQDKYAKKSYHDNTLWALKESRESGVRDMKKNPFIS